VPLTAPTKAGAAGASASNFDAGKAAGSADAPSKDYSAAGQEAGVKAETHVTLGALPQQQMELNLDGTGSPNQGNTGGPYNSKQPTALPISTKINAVGLKRGSNGSKPGTSMP
jgi:hypothetical protein